MPQRYGDFATWTGAIGTVAAFGIAYYQIHQERRHRLARELSDRIAAHREHADRVSAWVSGDEVVVSNQSGHPIHDVDLTVGPHDPGQNTDGADESEGTGTTVTVRLKIAPPGEHRASIPSPAPDQHVLHSEFTDTRGDRWSREPGGHPTRVERG